jgi:hypothetical protein
VRGGAFDEGGRPSLTYPQGKYPQEKEGDPAHISSESPDKFASQEQVDAIFYVGFHNFGIGLRCNLNNTG